MQDTPSPVPTGSMRSPTRLGMLLGMRATVTIDDDLFLEADRRAREMGLSRSGFYQRAVERFLRELRDGALTEQMNRYLEKHDDPTDDAIADYVAEVWGREMGEDEW